jgi:hypothetical protein
MEIYDKTVIRAISALLRTMHNYRKAKTKEKGPDDKTTLH